ncbi:MAG: hypothetical protein JOZ78_10075 [Chroococcidiopsidaceae cyanobacterium CP_BM_ER_R8_30]|nr:hypothetical protein [Chroococcidiopsidaceae cyanobacterium CP_BM_ER_R8_30]
MTRIKPPHLRVTPLQLMEERRKHQSHNLENTNPGIPATSLTDSASFLAT